MNHYSFYYMKDPKNITDKNKDIDDLEQDEKVRLPNWLKSFSDFLDDLIILAVFVLTFIVFLAVKDRLPAFGMSEVAFYIVWFSATFIILFFIAAVLRPLFKIGLVVAILLSPFIIYNLVFRKSEVTHNVYIQQQPMVDTAKTETIR